MTGHSTPPLCFAIGPYGGDGSDTRKWSDFLFDKVLKPVLQCDYVVQRTIDDPEPGKISSRIERDLSDARVVIADLTGANPNVYFELGFRHALERPFIHVARAGTELPFDIKDFEVIWVHADYYEAKGYFTISDNKLNEARNSLRAQLKKIADRANRPARARDPVSAKVYRWEMWYSPSMADAWLAKQSKTVRDEIACYEKGGGNDAVGDDSLRLFAEYLALKGAACQSGDGTIFITLNNHTGRLDFGYAAFKFASAPEPILINVADVTCSGAGVASISFVQHSRPFPIERGGQTVSVTIPGYKYTLHVEPGPSSADSSFGTIVHPRTSTEIGRAELTPRYGAFFR